MNLVEGIIKQCNRCRKLIQQYESIGPVGAFARVMIQRYIAEGEAALGSGDVVRMIQAYKALEGCQ